MKSVIAKTSMTALLAALVICGLPVFAPQNSAGDEMIKEKPDPEVLDAALISAAQRVEHYEMAAYGCLRTYAAHLDMDDARELLQRTLNEEGETDKLLTTLAEKDINLKAAS